MARKRLFLEWRLDCPNVVPTGAEIFQLTRVGMVEEVKCLLSQGKTSVKDTTIFGTTLLHSASNSGNLELVRLLIQQGANVNAQDVDGETPLHGAMARSNNYSVAKLLIESGADLSAEAIDGKTPFHAIFNNTIRQVIMMDSDLLESIAPSSEGLSVTHFLAWSSQTPLEIFQRGHLLDDSELWAADIFGRTCLHLAVSRGNLGILAYLVGQASPYQLEKKDIRGRAPFHYAVESSRAIEAIDILANKGCDVRAVDNEGHDALHLAVRRNNFKAAKKLIAFSNTEDLFLSVPGDKTSSPEVFQISTSEPYNHPSSLGFLSRQCAEVLKPWKLRSVRNSQKFVLDLSLVLKFIGLIALAFLVLLGNP
ncbi:MAG: hypothetical protein M1814_006161 [Vezdaea aestivalis]|nr:MAG: hypothetical protein M1814_006161 [Vezdaea aestivalis]